MRASDGQKSSRVVVRVDVQDRFSLQFVRMTFSPFGGADQGLFFTIPSAVNDRALGPPTGFRQLADGLGFSQNRDHSTDGIFRTVDPSVMMIAANNPFVGELAPTEAGDHVVGWNCIEVELEREVHRSFPWTEVIRDGQGAAPGRRSHRTLQRTKQW